MGRFGVPCRPLFTHLSGFKTGIQSQTCVLYSTRLVKIGTEEAPKSQGQYQNGQFFLHKVFHYRGVILFDWMAKVFDRTELLKSEGETPGNPSTQEIKGHESKGRTRTFYQVLIDERDYPVMRIVPESTAFFGPSPSSSAFYSVPGLDNVSHEDILPYSPPENHPLKHELFDKLLQYEQEAAMSPRWSPKESLKLMEKSLSSWLELSEVHKDTTEDIRVTVTPYFVGTRHTGKDSINWWRYCIRVENLGDDPVQLRERYWRIFSLSGHLDTVRGRGVVGKEPVLTKEEPAFQYHSHVSLQAQGGQMWGSFKMERKDGSTFDCRIPNFSLTSRSEK